MAEPFLVVGAMKSGTTTMDALCRAHPDIDVVAEKETSALLDMRSAEVFARRIRESTAVVAGEITAGYMQAPVVPQPVSRAVELLGGGLRIVAVLRDPVSRAVSHWEHMRHLGREHRPLDEALRDESSTYLAFSCYFEQLMPWRDAVGAERMLVLRLEDYASDPVGTTGRLWSFLGVQDQLESAAVHANVGTQRVVATGWRAAVRESPVYRNLIRPLVSPERRRWLVEKAGGGRGREVASVDSSLRRFVSGQLASDAEKLCEIWPNAHWEGD